MGKFRALMDQYGRVSTTDDMERLTDVIDCLFDHLPEDTAHKYILKAKLSNKHIPFDRDQAEHVVSKMVNKDGSTGEHWTYDQTSDVLSKKGYDIDEATWYYVLNMIYSDFFSPNLNTEHYVQMAHDYICDVDSPLDNSVKRIYIAKHWDK